MNRQQSRLLTAIIAISIMISIACGSRSSAPTGLQPTAESPGIVGKTPTPTPYYEATGGAEPAETDALGEVNIEYPMRMSPESSDTVILSVYVPALLASVKPMAVARVTLPDDVPAVIGDLNTYRTTILIAETMRAKLTSLVFEVESLHPAEQAVNIRDINQPTSWAWTLRAPDVSGNQVFTLKLYLRQEESPAWVGSFNVEVGAPTPTPLPTATATPLPTATPTATPTPIPPSALQRLGNQLIDNFVAVLGAVLTFAAAMIGIYAQHHKTKVKIDRLQEESTGLATDQTQELETLKKEIARLKAIKWWQFWRR